MTIQATPTQHRISDALYGSLRAWVHDYIDTKCIVRDTTMPGKRPGSQYQWMFYLRRGLFNPRFLISISQMFIYHMERLDPKLNFQITGLETAATPMLTAITLVAGELHADINAFVVRKERKEYGLLNMFEGLPNHKVAVMLDDLCNSSNSLAKCYWRLREEDIPVAEVAFVLVNKVNSTHAESRARTDLQLPDSIKVISLFTLDDFELSNPSH